jgi:uncharacterized coiled-coil protein SlyX
MIDKILNSFEQIQATMKKEAKELEGKLTAFGDSLDGYHKKIEEIIKKISKIVLPLVQDDRKIALQTTLQASIAKAKLGNVILNYPELIAWKETNTAQERSALIKEKITLLRPVLQALLENDRIKSDEIIRIVHEMVDIGIVVPESFTEEDDALREHQLELIRPKVAQLSKIFSAEENQLLFTVSSFKDIAGFVGKLKEKEDDVSQFLYNEFSAATRSLIDDPDSVPSSAFQESVITELNTLIQKPEAIYDTARFNGVWLSVATEQLKDKHDLEKKLQEKDVLAIVTTSDLESNLLNDPTQPISRWCIPKYELKVGGIEQDTALCLMKELQVPETLHIKDQKSSFTKLTRIVESARDITLVMDKNHKIFHSVLDLSNNQKHQYVHHA